MPGVPSGRGCEACRKQKKKCDQVTPACSRCTRLGIRCAGAGQQRFKFIAQQQNGRDQRNAESFIVKSRSSSPATSSSIPGSLISLLSSLRNAFIVLVQPSTDLRFNLAYTYGCFLEDIPARLGRNEALDTAALATITAHREYCSYRGASVEALTRYTKALKALRRCLDDPFKARAPETLSAVMLLLVTQGFLNLVEGMWTGHCEGVAKMLKARGCYNTEDAFETRVLLTMRGPVIFEALFNSNIQFSPAEWKAISYNPIDGHTEGGRLLQCLAIIPYLIENWSPCHQSEELITMINEVNSSYQSLKPILVRLKAQVKSAEAKMAREPTKSEWKYIFQSHAYIQRSYAITLVFAIILNLVLTGASAHTGHNHLRSQATYFAEEIVALAKLAKSYKPLGSSYMPLVLSFAWVGTTDQFLRDEILKEIYAFRGNSQMADRGVTITNAGLDWTARRLRLEKPEMLDLSEMMG